MTIIYRETDAVSGRWVGNSGGSNLSAAQVDGNFYECVSRITTLEGVPTGVGISSITQDSASSFTFHMSDSSLQGPFTIPTATFNDRGTWAPSTSYFVNDTFTENGTLYLVIFAHTSAGTFSAGANDGAGHNYYSAMLSLPGAALPTGGATGQMLKKSSGTDFAVTWGYPLPSGGSQYQVLMKNSATTQDAGWINLDGSHVTFHGSTASGLTATNVSAAIEEVEAALQTLAASSSGTLAGLSDVNFSTGDPQTGAMLYFGGTKWAATAFPSTNDIMAFDGTVWGPAAPSTLSLSFSQLTGDATAAQLRDPTITTLGTSGTVSLDPTLGNIFNITPSGAVTLNAASTPAGAEITLIVTTSGASSFNITPTTNFISTGALATGTVSGKHFVMKFVCNGVFFFEVSRTTAM